MARAHGRDATTHLQEVLAMCDHEGAHVSDNEPWEAIRLAAEHELTS